MRHRLDRLPRMPWPAGGLRRGRRPFPRARALPNSLPGAALAGLHVRRAPRIRSRLLTIPGRPSGRRLETPSLASLPASRSAILRPMAAISTITDEYRRLHPRSQQLYEEALRTFPSGVTHDIRYTTPFPIFIDHAQGSRKWDVDANKYIDYVMGHGALFLGHAHPEITQAVIEQPPKGTHYGASHRLCLRWGQRVRALVPSAEEVRFTSSGTEATLMAVRLARAYTGRDKLLKFDHHFHGWQDYVVGTRAAESDSPRSAGVPASTLGNTISIPQNNISLVDEVLAKGEFAAVILEPTGASWGTAPVREDLR